MLYTSAAKDRAGLGAEKGEQALASIAAATKRLPWWVGPITVTVVLTAFGVYSFYVAIFAQTSEVDGILSPFYSPQVSSPFQLALAGGVRVVDPARLPGHVLLLSQGLLPGVLLGPAGVLEQGPAARAAQPGELPRRAGALRVEQHPPLLPLRLDHRRRVPLVREHTGVLPGRVFRVTLGTLVLLLNNVFLSLYTFSCHSFRHLVGGNKDCYTCISGGGARRGLHNAVTRINEKGRHALWAWCSLFTVLFADVYIRLLLAGVIENYRIF
jgi:hypothetical protein